MQEYEQGHFSLSKSSALKSAANTQDLVCQEVEKQINDPLVTVMTFSLWACHYIPKQLSFKMILRAFFATISNQGHPN